MAKVWLDEEVSIPQNDGFSARELQRVRRLVRDHRQTLPAAWRDQSG